MLYTIDKKNGTKRKRKSKNIYSRRGRSCFSVATVVCGVDSGLCDRPIPRPEEFYRLCLTECD